MRGFWILIVMGLVWGHPSISSAQNVEEAELIGSWANRGDTVPVLKLRADKTLEVAVQVKKTQGKRILDSIVATAPGRWRVVGDTLTIVANFEGADGVPGPFRNMDLTLATLIQRNNGSLVLREMQNGEISKEPGAKVYQHLGVPSDSSGAARMTTSFD